MSNDILAKKEGESSSKTELQKLEQKLKKAEEKMKKAEEKMKLIREKFEKAQSEVQVQTSDSSRGKDTVQDKKDKKDKKRKRDIEEEIKLDEKVIDDANESEEKIKEVENEENKNIENIQKEEIENKKLKKEKKEKKKSKIENEFKVINNSIIKGDLNAKQIFQDEELSDQSKKNIYYAQLYSNRSTNDNNNNNISNENEKENEKEIINWKFNKAKQNWLIRNIFSNEEIPIKYLDIVLSYLKTVQGLSRNNLIESAKKIITPSSEDTTSSIETDVIIDKTDVEKKEVDGVEESTTTKETEMKINKEKEEEKIKLTLLKKERAQKLLQAMDIEV
ncbi:uncharacterized protein I206_104899 [Kwoniella pini CBS 10737]|uniref:WKF domain-containing protein n=1 Tax=Kwoniella pini CBS 10737 TaxID=1296096 RepID=A0A1B9I8A3_9TREE|nr:uncharacterized protein I206_02439 [Kwoniella pini CBS 10737]OCF51724.1 hypothetical protein I206_02439 [Kwoniella pini CBS 10737]